MSSAVRLEKTVLIEGVWQGVLTYLGDNPDWLPTLEVRHLDQLVEGFTLTKNDDPIASGWIMRVPIPSKLISDGVQTFVIVDTKDNDRLASFSILAGDALAEDIRAEIELLRAELDMLKRAFRRHCLETV